MSRPGAPYYVSFVHDGPPWPIDHSKLHPGPPPATNRAGYTKAILSARFTIVWDDLGLQNGRLKMYVQSANIYFRLKDFKIEISSQYSTHSCPYRVTLRHERVSHVHRPIEIFRTQRAELIRRINRIRLPTRQSTQLVRPADVNAYQSRLEGLIVAEIRQFKRDLGAMMERDRRREDSPANYRRIHSQCPISDW